MIIFNIVLPYHRSSLAAAPLSNAVDTNVVHAISKAHKKKQKTAVLKRRGDSDKLGTTTTVNNLLPNNREKEHD